MQMRTRHALKSDIRKNIVPLMSALISAYYEHSIADVVNVHSALWAIDTQIFPRRFPSKKFIENNLTFKFDSDFTQGLELYNTKIPYDDMYAIKAFIREYFHWLSEELSRCGSVSTDSIQKLFKYRFGELNDQ